MSGQPRAADPGNHAHSVGDRRGRRGLRSGFGAVLAGVMVAGLVSAPPVVGTSPGVVPGSVPQVVAAAPAGPPSVVVPMAKKKKRPRVAFTSKKRLVVNIDPDLRQKKNWKFKLQRKSTGKWRKVGIYRTRGKSEIRKLKVKKGKYRVKVYARPGYRKVTTKAYRFTPTRPDLTALLVVTSRVSVRSDGGQAAGQSVSPSISADGQWITYTSFAPNLVDNDTNNGRDVFLFDRDTGLTRRVSVRSNGDQATGQSYHPAISADGRWITYTSNAANLAHNDTNNSADVFLFDRDTGFTRRVSVLSNGDQATGGESVFPAISADGRWITYYSGATNLVDNDTNDTTDVFLFDRDTGLTRRVSVRSNGDQVTGGGSWHPAISADGRWITYTSFAPNLVDNDTNDTTDVFLFDRDTGVTRRVSVRSNGDQATGGYSGHPAISADGRWITYTSNAANLVDNDTNNTEDVFLFDRDTGLTRRVSVRSNGDQATGYSYLPAINADGRWTTYMSFAANLVDNDTNNTTDVFLFDRDSGVTRRVSVRSDGGQAGGSSGARLDEEEEDHPAISAEGQWITYHLGATNLVDDDTNTTADVFLTRMW